MLGKQTLRKQAPAHEQPKLLHQTLQFICAARHQQQIPERMKERNKNNILNHITFASDITTNFTVCLLVHKRHTAHASSHAPARDSACHKRMNSHAWHPPPPVKFSSKISSEQLSSNPRSGPFFFSKMRFLSSRKVVSLKL